MLTERECRTLHEPERGRRYAVEPRGCGGRQRWPDAVLETADARRAFEIEFAPKGTARLRAIVAGYEFGLYDDVTFFVKSTLADPHESPGYGPERLDVMEAEYRKFLALHLAFPGMDLVPCEMVDEMWPRHILDTQAYAEDTQALFGEFLHHYPYFGMNGPDDAQALDYAYAVTLERYRQAFGDPPPDSWISSDAAKCKRTACKPQKCR